MAISRTAAIDAVRQRIADTTTEYQYATTLLISLLTAALREMETEIREVSPDHFLTSKQITGYTDALDPGTYEFYALPSDLQQLRWIERADLAYRPKLWQYTTGEAEIGRYPASAFPPGTVAMGGNSFTIPMTSAFESISVMGDRFRALPALASATGLIFGVWYIRQIAIPAGDNDLLDLPTCFEEAVIQSTGLRAVERDEGPMAQAMRQRLAEEKDRARRNLMGRNGRRRILTSY